MMEQCLTFKGEKVKNEKNWIEMICLGFLLAFAISLITYGEENLLCLIFTTLILLLIAYLPSRLLFFCLFRFTKFSGFGFVLDDNARNIVTEKGRIIPYDKIKAIKIIKSADFYTVTASTGIFTKYPILRSKNDIKKENELFRELKDRFGKVRIKNISIFSFFIRLILIMLLIGSVMTSYLYFRFPRSRIFAEKRIQKIQEFSQTETNKYTFNKINFSLTKDFELAKEKDGLLCFCNQTEKIRILVDSISLLSFFDEELGMLYDKNFDRFSDLYSFQIGLKDDYDLLNILYNSQLGGFPLAFKAGLLNDFLPETVSVYEIEKGEFRGFLIAGTNKEMKNEKNLYIVNKKTNRQINFCIRSKGAISDILVDMLIEGLK